MVMVFMMACDGGRSVCRFVDRSKHSLFQPEDLSYPSWCGKTHKILRYFDYYL